MLTPVASHLFRPAYRWKEATFSTASAPLAFDMTPGVLGPAEGLAQAGHTIQAAFGFEQARHVSWKVCKH